MTTIEGEHVGDDDDGGVDTGWFAIDPAQSGWTTIGRARLSTGFLGEPIAQLTIRTPDGETSNEYWLRADPVDRRIEYLYHSEIEGAVVRDGTWDADDELAWAPGDDAELAESFAVMARLADGPAVAPLTVGMENDLLGEIDDEALADLAPLWSPEVADEPATEEHEPHGYDVLVAALAGLQLDDVAAMEFLVLREVAAWVFSDQNPAGGYDRSHASMLGGALFAGIDDAPGIELSAAPEPTDAMLAARERIAQGAQELATHGAAGVDMMVERRIVPSMIGELERLAGDTDGQARSAYVYLLYALACGERHDHAPDVVAGIVEGFDAWGALFAAAGAGE